MATELSKEQLQKIKAQAKDLDGRVRKMTSELVKAPWQIAKVCSQVKAKELFKYMGTTYPTIDEWRIDVRLGRSTFYRGIRLYDGLKPDVPEKELFLVPLENAEWLLKLTQEERRQPAMWKKAQEMTEKEFMEVVNDIKRSKGQSPEDGRVNLKIRAYAGQADFIKSTIEQFAEEKNLGDDWGRALELICADAMAGLKGGKTFIDNIGESITGAAFEISHTKGLVDQMRAEFDGKKNKSGDEILLAVSNLLSPMEDGLVKTVEILAKATKNMGTKEAQKKLHIPSDAERKVQAEGTQKKMAAPPASSRVQ